MKMLDSPECQWIFQGNWIEDGDLGKGWSIYFVYRTLELKFEHLASASAVYRLGLKRTRDSELVVGGTRSSFYRDGMLRCCFSRLQRPSHVPRLLCVSHLSYYFVRSVHSVLAFIPQSLMTSVTQSPKHWVLDSPYPLVQFPASGSSVVSFRPQILRDALRIYTLLVLSASSTLARTLEGC